MDCAIADGFWTCEGHPIVVEYASGVLQEIRRLAVDGYNAFGHGGLEIGGVLYGTREGDAVRVLGFAPVACEHAHGPGFALSSNDEAELRALLDEGAYRPLVPVGWYCSHTRSGIALSERDVRVYDSFFPEPWHIALVVKPTRWGPAQAGFFFRERTGVLRTQSSYSEFEIAPLKEELPAAELQISEPAAEVQICEPLPEQTEEAGAPEPPASPGEEILGAQPVPALVHTRRRRRRAWLWLAASLLLATGIVLALGSRRAPARLGLHTYELAGQLRIEWDRNAVPVRHASAGVLEIDDGGARTRIPLDAAQLQASSITYARRSGDVLVRMRVEPRQRGAAEVQELARFLGQPHEQPTAPQVADPPLQPEFVRSGEITGSIPAPETTPRTIPEQPKPAPDRSPPPRRALVVPSPVITTPHTEPVLAPPPAVAATPVPTVAAPFALTRVFPVPQLSATQAPAQQPVPAPPSYQGPRSGRLIWTGELARRGVVEIDGAHASIGTLSGALPGVPVVLKLHPAEFGPGGLVAYTADSGSHAREAPGPGNGWNATQFATDPARVRELAVLESPNPSNDFKRLVLRNDARNCPVILVEWSVK